MKKSELKFLIAAILKESAHMNRRERRALSQQLAATDTSAQDVQAKGAALNYLQKSNPKAAYNIAAERQRQLTLQSLQQTENTKDIPSEMIRQSLIKQIRTAEVNRKIPSKNLNDMDLGALQKYYNSIGQFDGSVHVPGHGWGGVNEGTEQVIYKDRQGGRDVYWMDNRDTHGNIYIKPEAVARMIKKGHRLVDLDPDPRMAKRQPDPDLTNYTELQEDTGLSANTWKLVSFSDVQIGHKFKVGWANRTWIKTDETHAKCLQKGPYKNYISELKPDNKVAVLQVTKNKLEESSNESFFPRLDLALNAIEEFLDKNKATVDDNEHPKDENADRHGIRKPFAYGGIPYEQSRDAHYKLLSYKGKLTRKYLHVSIYRMPSGSYELTKYIA